MMRAKQVLALMLGMMALAAVAGEGEGPPRVPVLIQAVRSGDVEQLRRTVRVEGTSLATVLNAEGDTLLHRIALLAPSERQAAIMSKKAGAPSG